MKASFFKNIFKLLTPVELWIYYTTWGGRRAQLQTSWLSKISGTKCHPPVVHTVSTFEDNVKYNQVHKIKHKT